MHPQLFGSKAVRHRQDPLGERTALHGLQRWIDGKGREKGRKKGRKRKEGGGASHQQASSRSIQLGAHYVGSVEASLHPTDPESTGTKATCRLQAHFHYSRFNTSYGTIGRSAVSVPCFTVTSIDSGPPSQRIAITNTGGSRHGRTGRLPPPPPIDQKYTAGQCVNISKTEQGAMRTRKMLTHIYLITNA